MNISLITLQFKASPYAFGEEVELLVQNKCGGCGQKNHWHWLIHIPYFGKALFKWITKRHHKKCSLWKVLGLSKNWAEDGLTELVLFGRESSLPETVIHRSWGFSVVGDWPTQDVIRAVLDGPAEDRLSDPS